jgi:hypothetical protein
MLGCPVLNRKDITFPSPAASFVLTMLRHKNLLKLLLAMHFMHIDGMALGHTWYTHEV